MTESVRRNRLRACFIGLGSLKQSSRRFPSGILLRSDFSSGRGELGLP